jgi:GT2 family glycosyltransferase
MGDTDDAQKFNSMAETAYACGCALFMEKTVLEKIGIFDEKFFSYFEETDFCYRARAVGFPSFFVPSAMVWHKISSSSGGTASPFFYYYMNRNVLLWAERHLPLSEKLKLYRYILKKLIKTMLPPGIRSVTSGKRMRFRWTFESLRNYTEACRKKYKDPAGKATLIGVRDYLLRRFGNCPESIRLLGK